MDSDLHAEHAKHAQQAQHAQHAQQAQHAQHAQHAQQAQYGCGAEFEEASPEALAELDQILTHARAYPADSLAACTLQEPDEEKPLTKLQLGRARLAAQKATTAMARKLQEALARAGRAAQRDELEHPTKRHSQKRASRADALAKEDAATILDILISIIRHYYS